jgi:hypothetical protein
MLPTQIAAASHSKGPEEDGTHKHGLWFAMEDTRVGRHSHAATKLPQARAPRIQSNLHTTEAPILARGSQ